MESVSRGVGAGVEREKARESVWCMMTELGDQHEWMMTWTMKKVYQTSTNGAK